MNKYTEFKKIKGKAEYNIYNKIYKCKIGKIKKVRFGTWMHWSLHINQSFMKMLIEKKQDLSFSNGCLKEISLFITKCYSVHKKSKLNCETKEDGKKK